VESILTGYLHRHGGDVLRSSRLVGLEDRGEGLLATIERDGATEELAVQWVVGCDGYGSTTRRLAGIAMAGDDIHDPWAVFDATLTDWPDPHEAIYSFFDEIPVILTSLPARRWRVYLRPSTPDSDLVADASATLHRYLPALRFDEVANPTRFHCHTKVAARFRSGRILLAGDAAHVCSPLQGHGMNTGLQDAFNLAWKLALVCRGTSSPDLLDSYEAERRPVADKVAAAGEAADLAQTMTDPAERRARDERLRSICNDATLRHHEAVGAAELDIDYGASPIVMGEANDALAPGQRLPNTIEVHIAGGKSRMLHELTNRSGHTALIIGRSRAVVEKLIQPGGLRDARNDAVIDAVIPLTIGQDGEHSGAWLPPETADQLGAGEITLLVIRPDGYVGLRADHDHLDALAAYRALLASGIPAGTPSDGYGVSSAAARPTASARTP
jgi:hypothetical protein